MKKKLLPVSLIAFILFCASCTKNQMPVPVLLCKGEITSIMTTTRNNGVVASTNTKSYQYDSLGRCTDNTYTSGSIISEGIFTYILNSNGIPIRENVINGSHYTFSYQSNGNLFQSMYYPMGSSLAGEIYSYQWQNGNLVTMIDSNLYYQNAILFTYTYTTEPYQQLDPDYIPLGNQSTYLVKTQTATQNGTVINWETFSYSYQFDNEGRVSSYIAATDTTSNTYNLTYKCN